MKLSSLLTWLWMILAIFLALFSLKATTPLSSFAGWFSTAMALMLYKWGQR